MSRHNFIIPENLDGLRVDKALSLYCSGTSRSQIQKAIKHQKLLLNGQIISSLSLRVKKNDTIDLLIEEEVPSGMIPSNIPLDIIYEDNDLIVINKCLMSLSVVFCVCLLSLSVVFCVCLLSFVFADGIYFGCFECD